MADRASHFAASSPDELGLTLSRRESRGRLLVIGSTEDRASLRRIMPDCDVALADEPLEGVWRGESQSYDGVIVSMQLGGRALQTVRSLREKTPLARIVVTCRPSDEPLARRALLTGADDYVLEPLSPEEMEKALGMISSRSLPPVASAGPPSVRELTELSEVLRRLDEGVRSTLQRFASTVQQAFESVGVLVELDGEVCTAGDIREPILEEAVLRDGVPVGRISLARGHGGAYAAQALARLGEYACLLETLVAELRKREKLQDLAWTDDLSGLRNRRFFEHALDELIAHALQNRQCLTLLLLDIDNFKTYNDALGHEVGDQLIREMAVLLSRCLRERDVVARIGGDEFAVILWDAERQRVPGSQHPREFMAVAQRFRQAIEDHDFRCLGATGPAPVTISGGLACLPWSGITREQLMRAADQAMLEAKRTGKNTLLLAPERTDAGAPPDTPRAAGMDVAPPLAGA